MTQAELDAEKQAQFDALEAKVTALGLSYLALHSDVHDLEDRVAALEGGAAGTTGKK